MVFDGLDLGLNSAFFAVCIQKLVLIEQILQRAVITLSSTRKPDSIAIPLAWGCLRGRTMSGCCILRVAGLSETLPRRGLSLSQMGSAMLMSRYVSRIRRSPEASCLGV